MTYEIYRYIFIIGLVLSLLMAAVAIILFFVLKIPKVIGDLNGSNARKAIENIRNSNESTGEKTYKSSYVNSQRGKITDKISASGSLLRKHTDQIGAAMATERIDSPNIIPPAEETTVLTGVADETTVLTGVADETTVLSNDSYGVDVPYVQQFADETTVLSQPRMLSVIQSIVYIHTDEVIG